MPHQVFRFVSTNPACQIQVWSHDYELDKISPAALGQIQQMALMHAAEMQLRPGQQQVRCYLDYAEARDGTVQLSWVNERRPMDNGQIGGITLPATPRPTPVAMDNPPMPMEEIEKRVDIPSIVSSSLLTNAVPKIYLKTEFAHSLMVALAGVEKTHRALLRELNLRTDEDPEFNPYDAAIQRMTDVRNHVMRDKTSPGGTGD